MKKSLAGIFLVFAVGLFIASCGGGGTGAASSTTSGLISAAAGGTLTSSDGKLVLTIPPGALSEDTTISITLINNAGAVEYELEPDGLTFSTPITAQLTMDVADQGALLDENGDPLDLTAGIASAFFFTKSIGGDLEAIDNVVITGEGDSVITATMQLSHFTSLVGAAGNSYYAYLSSLGTHYVGSAFKRDLDIRYLGYTGTNSYLNMSISYLVRSITVNKISFAVSGQIDITSPKEITRSDFLSKRGDTSSTRPRFICKDPGDGTVTATVDVSAIVEATFQPENKTLVYNINQSESVTRKAKCLAPYIGSNDAFNAGGEEGVRVAVNDPVDDLMVNEGGTLVAADGFSLPGYIDATKVYLGVVNDEAVEANIVLNSDVIDPTEAIVPVLGFTVGLIDAEIATGIVGFEDISSFVAVEAQAPSTALMSALYGWDGMAYALDEGADVEMDVDGNVVSMLVQLSDLGLTPGKFLLLQFQMATEFEVDTYAGAEFFDFVDLAF